ncbi:hypothetical protein ASF71_16475 [Deinococcus sp. Leaf326]|nr:hypothetical protein ASF71_16475 [Deinococcus sp. Leaf326]
MQGEVEGKGMGGGPAWRRAAATPPGLMGLRGPELEEQGPERVRMTGSEEWSRRVQGEGGREDGRQQDGSMLGVGLL